MGAGVDHRAGEVGEQVPFDSIVAALISSRGKARGNQLLPDMMGGSRDWDPAIYGERQIRRE